MPELRAENRSLRRQLTRLRQENQTFRDEAETRKDEYEAFENVRTDKETCPKCNSTDLGTISTPNGKTVTSCRSCKKWRSRAR
jgi:hypothetical protein